MIAIKFLHIFALMLGAAASIANLMISRQIGGELSGNERLAAMRPKFSRLGLVGVFLIWITGIWLYAASWNGADLGPVFTLKLIAASLLLIAVIAINVAGMRSARTGQPPPSMILKLGPVSLILTLIAVGAAIWVFG